jgi:hypothetical protein
MKKNLLLMMMCCPVILAAQNGVTVKGLNVSSGTVTFNVSWETPMPVELWSDTVWVFVDYNNKGVMERLPLSPGATLTATSPGGKVIEETGNNKGVWVAGNARNDGSFSATVKLLTEVKDIGGACVYGSNYPPVGEYSKNDASEITFTGTPQYDVVLLHESGNLATTTTSSLLNIPASYTVHSFTDKTAAPGKLACIPSTVYDLTASALSFCEGGTGVTFALSGTELGRIYQLYKDGTTAVATLPGTGSAATFSSMVNKAGTYTARAIALLEYCPAVMGGSHAVASVPAPEAPVLAGSSSYCTSGTITATAGDGGTGIRWDDGSTDALRTVSASGMYYAVTTSDTDCNSSAATIIVAGTPPGTEGNAVGACGCVDGLVACAGICRASCSNVTRCGLAEVSPNTHDALGTLTEVSNVCKSKGMRVPTAWEMYCLTRDRELVPGGLADGYYWATPIYLTECGGTTYGVHCDSRGGECAQSSSGHARYVKCVK